MKKTLKDKLNDLLFPKSESRKIVKDILEELCDATSDDEHIKRPE